MTDPTDSAVQEQLAQEIHHAICPCNDTPVFADDDEEMRITRAVLDSPAFHAAVQAEVERRVRQGVEDFLDEGVAVLRGRGFTTVNRSDVGRLLDAFANALDGAGR